MSKIELMKGDCLKLMPLLPDKSIDMILCDLPYGMTQCRWDTIIPFEPLWEQYERIIKDHGVIALFSLQPFTAKLIMSNIKLYRYEWIWVKTHPRGHLNANRMPMRAHENIEIFYKKLPLYNPQMTHGHKHKVAKSDYIREADGNGCYGREVRHNIYNSSDRYPLDVQIFSTGDQSKKLHPTQKPVELLEYLIKTYTREEDIVLDNCMGSGRTGVACIHTKRKFIGMELEKKFFELSEEEITTLIRQEYISNC